MCCVEWPLFISQTRYRKINLNIYYFTFYWQQQFLYKQKYTQHIVYFVYISQIIFLLLLLRYSRSTLLLGANYQFTMNEHAFNSSSEILFSKAKCPIHFVFCHCIENHIVNLSVNLYQS